MTHKLWHNFLNFLPGALIELVIVQVICIHLLATKLMFDDQLLIFQPD